MHIIIKDFPGAHIDKLITQDMDLFTRSVVVSVPLCPVETSLLNITVEIDSFHIFNDCIIIKFPNRNVATFDVPSDMYSSIEVY